MKEKKFILVGILKQLNSFYGTLGGKTYHSKCVEMFLSGVEDTRFIEKLDQNPYLLGFNNGVYDIENKIFIDKPSSDLLISKTVGYDYKEYSMEDPDVKFILEFYRKCIPNEKWRDYALDYRATIAIGENFHRGIMHNVGTGKNGKSVDTNLLASTFGEYAGTVPIEF